MLIHIQDDVLRLQGMGLLEPLLADRTTGRNILWATDAYAELGRQYARNEEITASKITGDCAGIIRTRARKAFEQQSQRTKQRAEVFTPLWIVEKMNDHLDEAWFQRKDGIHKTDEQGRIAFNTRKTWQQYVENRRLEITCGEAPFLTTRYDAVSGEILPLEKRVGLLDRKLRAVSENNDTPGDWFTWALRALRATFAYEFQGDSLLIARINVIMALWEFMEARWGQPPTAGQLRKAAEIVTWNFWQMDGLTDRVPYAKENLQLSMFDLLPDAKPPQPPYCRIKNWRQQRSNQYRSLKGERTRMKFDYIIGNPPYQEESIGANANDTPIYHYFYDESYKVGEKVELISPARFLFNAGGTPKAWNEKMLNDPHIKVLMYEQKSDRIFPGTCITGGLTVLYRDKNTCLGPIDVFTPFVELNSIVKKVESLSEESLMNIVSNRGQYRYSQRAYVERPNEMRLTADPRIAPSAFSRMPELFTDEMPNDGNTYIRIYGNEGSGRVFKWFRRDYISSVENIDKYKVFISKADGAAGQIGNPVPARISGRPVVMGPGVASTETYISIGSVETEDEAISISKYIQTRFCRLMLGVLKVTQNYAKPTWRKIPLQDFTPNSDIDWSQSVAEIDRQLYAKYGLDEKEIEFIETHVKEMA